MKWLLVFLIFPPVFSATQDDKFHICFFELDNTKTSENFNSTVKGKCGSLETSDKNTLAHCYQPRSGEQGIASFKRMIETVNKTGGRCDSLVMSGHHTGDWYGKTGKLKLKDLEDLSCDPKYKGWFSNIKALWLDGCNTVTDNLLESGSAKIPTPDTEATRVVTKEYLDKGKSVNRWAITNTSQAYTASLDKNTPLSSRYLRMFPQTQIYGFNGASPEGKDKGKTSFIANHLSLLGSALQAEQSQKSQKDTIQQALTAILSSDPCDEDKIEAWEEASWGHLQTEAIENLDYKKEYQLGCNLILAKQLLDDPDSEESQKALADYIKTLLQEENVKNKRQVLALADDILKRPNSEKAVQLAQALVLNTLDEITEQDKNVREEKKTYTHLLFNNIYDTWKTAQKYEQKDNSFYKEVQKKLQADNFTNSLKERVESNQTASLRKGDYIKFYMEVNERQLSNTPSFIKTGISELVHKAESVFEGLRSPRHKFGKEPLPVESRRALAVSVADQLFQYELLTDTQIKEFLNNRSLFPKDYKNPFVTEVKVSLYLSDSEKETRMIEGIKAGKVKPNVRMPALRALSRRYIQNPLTDKEALQSVAGSMNLDSGSDVKIFFDVMHTQFSHYTQKEQEDFIVEYSQKSDGNLEELLLWYADTNFTSDREKAICGRLRANQVKARNLRYVCKD